MYDYELIISRRSVNIIDVSRYKIDIIEKLYQSDFYFDYCIKPKNAQSVFFYNIFINTLLQCQLTVK